MPSAQNLLIRPFRDEDAEKLSEMIRNSYLWAVAEHPEYPEDYIKKRMESFSAGILKVSADTQNIYVAENERGEIVGTGSYRPKGTAAELRDFFVRHDLRRSGIGSRMLKQVEFEIANKHPEINEVYIETEEFDPAIDVYKKKRFRHVMTHSGKGLKKGPVTFKIFSRALRRKPK